jgi:hypothetical protein
MAHMHSSHLQTARVMDSGRHALSGVPAAVYVPGQLFYPEKEATCVGCTPTYSRELGRFAHDRACPTRARRNK